MVQCLDLEMLRGHQTMHNGAGVEHAALGIKLGVLHMLGLCSAT